MHDKSTKPSKRRSFLRQVTAGAAALGMGLIASPVTATGIPDSLLVDENDPDSWFNQIKGKHRMVYDVTEPKGLLPFAWPRVFLLTNEKTGTPESQITVVVVLHHAAIPYAMGHQLWEKYKFGEMFKIDDADKKPAISNAFWQPTPGTFKVPGVGPVAIGMNELQDSGVMFCVCDMALTLYSAVAAESMNKDAAETKKEWIAGILPGVQIVPSGVWAVGRAQEHGCAYCFVG